ncbi:MAG TPA: hypothetical protein PJ990_15365, partial [Saprospiraceae bacterium]|nr:hypothetical protein [Saprospiraceae bacterium]
MAKKHLFDHFRNGLTSFSFVHAKVVTGFDTKETKNQGCFIFLMSKLQKIAKHKKLASDFVRRTIHFHNFVHFNSILAFVHAKDVTGLGS